MFGRIARELGEACFQLANPPLKCLDDPLLLEDEGAKLSVLSLQLLVKPIAERLDDDVLDAIARIWHRGKGV